MLDSPYVFEYLGRSESGLNDPKYIAKYRFKGAARKYLVIFDTLKCGFVEFKFCSLRDQGARNSFTKIYNDGDSVKVISTCINILFDYWRRFPESSFWIYAVPRISESVVGRRTDGANNDARYSIFKTIFQNVFSPSDFHHAYDDNKFIYVLTNTRNPDPLRELVTLSKYLFSNYSIIFSHNRID